MGPLARYANTPHPHGAEEPDGQPAPAFSSTEDDAGVPLHPVAKRLFDRCPVLRRIPIFGEACGAYGPACTLSLGLCYLLSKGLVNGFLGGCTLALFNRRFGLTPERYQRLADISTLGWSIKAFTAVLCDAFALLGYTKRWYMFGSCVVCSLFALLCGLLPAKPSSGNIAATFLFLSSFGVANVDILSEGYYSRLMRKIPKAGPALVSWIWWAITFGGTVASVIQGPLSDLRIPQVGLFLAAGLQLLTSLIFFFNLYGERTNREERAEDARIMHKVLLQELEERKALHRKEEESGLDVIQGKALPLEPFDGNEALALADDLPASLVHSDQYQAHELKGHTGACQDEPSSELLLPLPVTGCCGLIEFNREVIMRNKRIVVYSAVMTAAVIAMGVGKIFANTLGLLIICVVISLVCTVMSFWALPLVIAKFNVFNYLTSVVCISFPALQNFYIAEPECLPDGPHFSITFCYTVCAIISTVFSLIGIALFKYFLEFSYRRIMIVTTIALVPFVLPEIIMLKRWNTKIGIPDHAFYIGTSTVISPLIGMISWMTIVTLLSRMCPRGSESTMYAILAGFSNLGQTTSSSIGSILIEYVWPIKGEPVCDFGNGVWLVIVGHILTPLLIIPLTLLLPKARVCDNIDVDGNVVSRKSPKESAVEPAQHNNEER